MILTQGERMVWAAAFDRCRAERWAHGDPDSDLLAVLDAHEAVEAMRKVARNADENGMILAMAGAPRLMLGAMMGKFD